MTSQSPLTVTSSRFRYQDLRGLTRSLFSDLPVSMSQVHLTSWAVNGLPSCHLTPWRNGKVSSVPSSLHAQPVARSGTIDCRLFCFTCWSKRTRLLNTPIIGPSATKVISSWIDMLAGLSRLYILRMPPAFWANAAALAEIPANHKVTANAQKLGFISSGLPGLSNGCPIPLFDFTHSRSSLSPSL